MSLFNLNVHNNAEGSEARVLFARSVAVSEIGSKQSDELKKNTLLDDVVTFSSENSSSQNQNLFSKNRFQALAAYKNFGRTSIQTAAKEVMASQESTANVNPNMSDATAALKSDSTSEESSQVKDEKTENKDAKEKKTSENSETKPNGEELTDEEKAKLQKLKERDTEVVTHEKAHQAAGGQYASAPSYEYEKGPDGKNYAVGGHVNIDVSEESDPDKTIQKMRIVIKAAKAPAQPSGQDMKVASEAQQKITKAQMEKTKEREREQENEDEKDNPLEKDKAPKNENISNTDKKENTKDTDDSKSVSDVSGGVSKLSDADPISASNSAAVSKKMDIA